MSKAESGIYISDFTNTHQSSSWLISCYTFNNLILVKIVVTSVKILDHLL